MDDVAKAINYFNTLMEDQNAKLDAVLEGMKDLSTREDLGRFEQKVNQMSDDLKIVHAAVTATNRDVTELDHRVARLETV